MLWGDIFVYELRVSCLKYLYHGHGIMLISGYGILSFQAIVKYNYFLASKVIAEDKKMMVLKYGEKHRHVIENKRG